MQKSTAPQESELTESLDALERELRRLAGQLQQTAEELWLWSSPEEPLPDKADLTPAAMRRSALDRIARIVRAIEYHEGQDPGSTEILSGIVAVNAETIAQAQIVNAAKRRVGIAWSALQGEKIEVIDRETGQSREVSLRMHTLETCGRARHHHRQAIRELVVFDRPLDYVGFSWARTRAITRTDCAAVREELEALDDDASGLIAADLRALSDLPADEPLARIRKQHVQPRANIAWHDQDGKVKRAVVRAAMPILVQGTKLPRFRRLPPEPLPANYRMQRSDVKIEAKPFLKTRSVYRYLDPQEARRRRLPAGKATPDADAADPDPEQ